MLCNLNVSSAIATALGLAPTSSSSESQIPGEYLYIHADGYNHTLHSVEVEELEPSESLYAEESEPVELGILISISESNNERSAIFKSILDESIVRGIVELEKGYLESKNDAAESQGIAAKYFRVSSCCVDLIDLGKSGEWECLYRRNTSLQYLGEADDYEFEETDEDVFTAGYTIESIKRYALVDVSEDGSVKAESYTSSKEILGALEAKGAFVRPGIIEQFRSMYSGKAFTLSGTYEWCNDEERLKEVLQSHGL